MKKTEDYIENFTENRKIISQFLVIDKQLKKSLTNKTYVELTLQDKTGYIKARMFSKHAHKEYEDIEKQQVYNIVGKIQEFPENTKKFNILLNSVRKANNYDIDEFIKDDSQLELAKNYLKDTIETIEDTDLKLILEEFFKNEEFLEIFTNSPAAKIHHHNYSGGLLIHTIEVVKICENLCNIYEKLDHDLLITGALLHDIGKIETYETKIENIQIKFVGYMLDHIYIGANMVDNVASEIGVDDDTRIKLIHMILSHHGETSLGWGSTVDPKIPEALALHYADDISAKITSSLENK